MRAQLEKKLAQKEKEKKEEHLRALAQKAREERAGIRTSNAVGMYQIIYLTFTYLIDLNCLTMFFCFF